MHENRALELVGNFGDQFGRRFLQLSGFRQQLANASNPFIFQIDGSLKPGNNSPQAEQALYLQRFSSVGVLPDLLPWGPRHRPSAEHVQVDMKDRLSGFAVRIENGSIPFF
jgi:hypothetical protein